MVDEYRLIAGSSEPVAITKEGPTPVARERDGAITLRASDARLIVDASTGMIREYSLRGQSRITGGPHLHLTGLSLEAWALDENGLSVERAEHETLVTTTGAYGALKVRHRLSLSGNGVLSARIRVAQRGIESA